MKFRWCNCDVVTALRGHCDDPDMWRRRRGGRWRREEGKRKRGEVRGVEGDRVEKRMEVGGRREEDSH